MKRFVRARSPEQKEQRRAHLLGTARAMLEAGESLPTVTLNELARRAEMTKSNVYRYFESREALLLELLRDEWTAWLAGTLETWPKRRRGADPVESAVGHVARALAARPLLCLLTSAMPTVLEQNLSEEAIIAFKRISLELVREVARAIAERAPEIPEAACLQLVHDAVPVVVGLYPLAHPTAAVECALRVPELKVFARDFAKDLERFLLALARDAIARAGGARRPA